MVKSSDNHKTICLYAVPNPYKRSGGSRTRILEFKKAILEISSSNTAIVGNSFFKLNKTISLGKVDICYVESSTNRLKLIDILCLFILRIKADKMSVYIRDIYTIILPDEYSSFRRKITKFANYLSNKIYLFISDKLCFPTIEMGKIFMKEYNSKKEYFDLPPGTFDKKNLNILSDIEYRIQDITFLYLGGTTYEYSGFDQYLLLADRLSQKFNFHILTNDDIKDQLERRDLINKVEVDSVPHEQVFNYIIDNKITFLLHTRPRNNYDDITYPIKIMDCISIGLPFITLKHVPLINLVGEDYVYQIDDFSTDEILSLTKHCANINDYEKTIRKLYNIKEKCSYHNQINKLQNCLK